MCPSLGHGVVCAGHLSPNPGRTPSGMSKVDLSKSSWMIAGCYCPLVLSNFGQQQPGGEATPACRPKEEARKMKMLLNSRSDDREFCVKNTIVNLDLRNVDYANQPSLTGKDFSKSRNITSQKDMNDAVRF